MRIAQPQVLDAHGLREGILCILATFLGSSMPSGCLAHVIRHPLGNCAVRTGQCFLHSLFRGSGSAATASNALAARLGAGTLCEYRARASGSCLKRPNSSISSSSGSSPRATKSPSAVGTTAVPPRRPQWWRNLVPAFPIGFAAGFGGACAGAGGAIFMIPALVRYVNLPQRVAQGTALLASCGTATSSAYNYAAAGCVDLPAALQLMVCSIIMAPIGVAVGQRVNASLLRRGLGILLILLAPLVPLRDRLLSAVAPTDPIAGANVTGTSNTSTNCAASDAAPAGHTAVSGSRSPASQRAWSRADQETQSLLAIITTNVDQALLWTGTCVGFLSGLLGVSGGTLYTPSLALLYASRDRDRERVARSDRNDAAVPSAPAAAHPEKHGVRTIIGTSMFAMVFPAAAAGIGYARRGQVSFLHLPGVILGTLTGAAIGSRAAMLVDESVLRFGFAIVFATLGVRLIRSPVTIERTMTP
jgi:uncharacterized membrane protein YfcA